MSAERSVKPVANGPLVYVDQSAQNCPKPSVDTARLVGNIGRDFPEISIADWSDCAICLTDRLAPKVASASYDLSLNNRLRQPERKSELAALGLRASDVASWSQGKNYLSVVNLSYDCKSVSDNAFYGPERPLSHSALLSQEIRNLAGFLTNKCLPNQEPIQSPVSKNKLRVFEAAKYLSVGAMAITTTGLIFETVAAFYNAYNKEAFLATGGAVIASGFAYSGTQELERQANSSDQEIITSSLSDTNADSEMCAAAYAIAAYDKWQDIITFSN